MEFTVARKKKKRKSGQQPDNLVLKIEDLNDYGNGVAFLDKQKITVKKTLPGEEVLVRYLPHRPRKDRIRLLKILEISPVRVEPPCPYYLECGGCHLQHLPYEKQLDFKKSWLQRLLLPYPDLKPIRIEPVTGMKEALHYRNKTQMPFREINGQVVYGLYRQGTHEIVPVDYCLVENNDANRALQIVREWANQYNISPYDEQDHSGVLRYVVVRRGTFTNQVMVVVVSPTRELPHWQQLRQALREGLPSLKSLILNINSRRTNVVLGEENLQLWGSSHIYEKLGRIRYRIYPNTFFQTNSVQMVKILEKVVNLVDFRKTDRLLDLFSGVGAIGLYLSGYVESVIGLESNPEAVTAARQNAEDNEIRNAKFIAGDVSRGIAALIPEGFHPDIIVLDPPRKGLTPHLIRDIVQMNPREVVYISCNPKSLVADLAEFHASGYVAEQIFPFDMFPHTSHVESLVVMKQKK